MTFHKLNTNYVGTEGICYKACQRSTGIEFAVKRSIIPGDGGGVPYFMLRDLAFLSSAHHPNIIKMQMAFMVGQELHIFLPFVEYTLVDLIGKHAKEGKLFSQRMRKHLLLQLLQGINYCHERGVLHRNLVRF